MLTDNHFFVSSSWDKTIKVCRIDAPHTEILQINTKPREWHFDAKYSLDCKKIITSNPLIIWDAQTGEKIDSLTNYRGNTIFTNYRIPAGFRQVTSYVDYYCDFGTLAACNAPAPLSVAPGTLHSPPLGLQACHHAHRSTISHTVLHIQCTTIPVLSVLMILLYSRAGVTRAIQKGVSDKMFKQILGGTQGIWQIYFLST